MFRPFASLLAPACLFLTFVLGAAGLLAQNPSSLVYPGPDGKLVYAGYANEGQTSTGNKMIDFSHAGYMGGGVAIPWVPVEITLDPEPGAGDDHARIQTAIDSLSALPLSSAGFRGALLLRAGTYRVSQRLNIRASGIVIRGEGQHSGGTVVRLTATVRDDLFDFRGSGGWTKINGTETLITDEVVPSGTRSFDVASTAGLAVGDRLMIHRTPNQAWISLLGMDQLESHGVSGIVNWTPEAYRATSPRVITSIVGNTVTVDAPLVHAIESQYGGGEVYRYHFNGALRHVGIERIRLESAFTSDTDEDHGWNAVNFANVENAWARQVTAQYFGYSCINVTSGSQFITVEDCAQLDPKSITTGGRKYSFNLSGGAFILMQRCYTRGGRHDYVTGARVRGPNVFVDSLAQTTFSDIGPHHRYAEGLLFDNIRGGSINVQNRLTSGTGHGWAGAQTTFWNCHATTMVCDAPKAAMNFAIGCIGEQRQGSWVPAEPDGIWESRGVPVTPRSLYYTQLADRLGHHAVATVTTPLQAQGTIWSGLSAWKGDSEAPGLPAFAPLRIDVGSDILHVTDSHQLNAIIRYPLPGNFPMTQGWTQLSGPAEAVFENASSPSTSVTFPAEGVYQFRFSASQADNRDQETIITYSGSDTLLITAQEPPIATVGRSSADMIVGRRQPEAQALGYYADSANNVIGGTGSSVNSTRADRDVVLGYTLPVLPAGSTITGATLHFEITSSRNESGANPGLDVYLLDTAAPEDSGAEFFFRGVSDPNPKAARVGGVKITQARGGDVNYPGGTHLQAFNLSGNALSLLQSFYGSDGTPTPSKVFFRYNLNHTVGTDIRLDRYRIDIGAAGSRLELFGTPGDEPGNTFAVWLSGYALGELNGFADDADGDGIPNAVENIFGTHPGEFSQGLVVVAATDDSLTFTHPRNPTPASDISAAYLWSTDLVTFHPGGTEADGTTVTFHALQDAPEPGITTVTATIAGNSVARLFVTLRVTGN